MFKIILRRNNTSYLALRDIAGVGEGAVGPTTLIKRDVLVISNPEQYNEQWNITTGFIRPWIEGFRRERYICRDDRVISYVVIDRLTTYLTRVVYKWRLIYAN